MEVLHDVWPKHRLGLTALTTRLLACAFALAACRDAPERASQPVDTAALEDRRIFEGEIGHDTGHLAGDTRPAPNRLAGTGVPAVEAEPTLVLEADSAAGFLAYHRSAGCIACHGADGQGIEHLGPSLQDSTWLHIDGSLRAIEDVMRAGIARPLEAMIAMPALATRLDSLETYRVAAYVYSLSHPGAVVPDTAAARDSLRARADSIVNPP